MAETLTDDDEGKSVVDADGQELGVFSGVRDGDPYVNPGPDMTEQVMSKLGWGGADTDEDIELPEDSIETVTDDEIRLRRFD